MKSLKEQSLATFDKILAPAILTFLSGIPEVQLSLMLAYGFFGVSMQYKQNDVNNFVKILKDNPKIFTKKIMKTREFQDGFVIILENYIKERNKNKKEIIKNIFLGFTKLTKEQKEEFELEKMLDILNKLVLQDINLLIKLNNGEIDEVIKQIDSSNFSNNYQDKNYFNLKYFESLGLLNIDFNIETSEVEKVEGDEESGVIYTGEYYTKINNIEFFELSLFGKEFIKYINNE